MSFPSIWAVYLDFTVSGVRGEAFQKFAQSIFETMEVDDDGKQACDKNNGNESPTIREIEWSDGHSSKTKEAILTTHYYSAISIVDIFRTCIPSIVFIK